MHNVEMSVQTDSVLPNTRFLLKATNQSLNQSFYLLQLGCNEKYYIYFSASPFLKNLITLPTNMQSIPMTSGPQRRSVPVWSLMHADI